MAAEQNSVATDDLNLPNADVHNMFLRPAAPGNAEPNFDNLPDSQYVYSSVGRALVLALSEAAAKRPQDPIEYIAERLKNFRATQIYCQQRDDEFNLLRQARIKKKQEEARQKAIEEEVKLQKEMEEQKRKEELERMRQTVPLETLQLPRHEERDKTGATELHEAVKSCSVELLLQKLHEGFSFCARDSLGHNVRDVAAASKNDAVVKEIDSLVIGWIKQDKVEYLRWLIASGYAGSLPNLKKYFGPKLNGIPAESRKFIDSIPQFESQNHELWKLSAKGTKEHLDEFFGQISDQFNESVFARNKDNLSAIHIAILCKNLDTVAHLVSKFPKILQMEDGFGRLPIHFAYGAGQEFVDAIHSAGGNQSEEVKDAFGFVPNIYARRPELLPEPPAFESPNLIVTADADQNDDALTDDDAAAAAAAATAADTAADDIDVDQSKLTPINEDEAEEA